jgi:hypothetical protein
MSRVYVTPQVGIHAGWLKVVTPYSGDFVDELKWRIRRSRRWWNSRERAWFVHEAEKDTLGSLLKEFFPHNKPSDPTTRAPQSFKPPPLPPAHTYWAQILDMMDDDQWRRSRRTILASMHPDPSESSGNEEKFKKVSELLELIEKLRKKTKNGA